MTPDDIIGFWLEAGPERWFKKDNDFDEALRQRFGAVLEQARAHAYDAWAETPCGLAALVIVLDQFSRNILRNSAGAFTSDAMALELAKRGIARGDHRVLEPHLAQWLVLPFEHSEDLQDQETAVRLFKEMARDDLLKWAELHRDIIQRFGRFPHRNALLGRVSTEEEEAFLAEGGFAG